MKAHLYSVIIALSAFFISCQKKDSDTTGTPSEGSMSSAEQKSGATNPFGEESNNEVFKSDRPKPEPESDEALNGTATNPMYSKEMMERSKKMMATMNETKRKKELLTLDRLLNLSDEQKAAIAQYHIEKDEIQNKMQAKVMEKMGKGESVEELMNDKEYMKGLKGTKPIKTAMKEILSEEQFEAYTEDQEKQKERKKESVAYRELANIQGSIDMSNDQKDAVLKIFYDKKYAKYDPSESTPTTSINAMEHYITRQEKQNERLLNELGTVLSPDQLELYKMDLDAKVEQIKASQEMMKSMSPQSNK